MTTFSCCDPQQTTRWLMAKIFCSESIDSNTNLAHTYPCESSPPSTCGRAENQRSQFRKNRSLATCPLQPLKVFKWAVPLSTDWLWLGEKWARKYFSGINLLHTVQQKRTNTGRQRFWHQYSSLTSSFFLAPRGYSLSHVPYQKVFNGNSSSLKGLYLR